MCRASAIIIEIACSAVVTLLPSGLFITTMPRRVAASRSTLSTPTPGAADHLQRIGALDDLARDLGRAANHQRVVGRDYFRQFGRLEPSLDVDLELRIAAEHLDSLRMRESLSRTRNVSPP